MKKTMTGYSTPWKGLVQEGEDVMGIGLNVLNLARAVDKGREGSPLEGSEVAFGHPYHPMHEM